MTTPRLRREDPGRVRRAGPALAGLALLLAGLAGTARAPRDGEVIAQLGPITVSATALRPGPAGMLNASVQVTTSGQPSDQLDVAIAAGGTPVALYHQQVSVGGISDLASCGGATPPRDVVDQWLHYGPLLVPGSFGGSSPPAAATLTVQPTAPLPADGHLAITFYFAHAGVLTLDLPVSGA